MMYGTKCHALTLVTAHDRNLALPFFDVILDPWALIHNDDA